MDRSEVSWKWNISRKSVENISVQNILINCCEFLDENGTYSIDHSVEIDCFKQMTVICFMIPENISNVIKVVYIWKR